MLWGFFKGSELCPEAQCSRDNLLQHLLVKVILLNPCNLKSHYLTCKKPLSNRGTGQRGQMASRDWVNPLKTCYPTCCLHHRRDRPKPISKGTRIHPIAGRRERGQATEAALQHMVTSTQVLARRCQHSYISPTHLNSRCILQIAAG